MSNQPITRIILLELRNNLYRHTENIPQWIADQKRFNILPEKDITKIKDFEIYVYTLFNSIANHDRQYSEIPAEEMEQKDLQFFIDVVKPSIKTIIEKGFKLTLDITNRCDYITFIYFIRVLHDILKINEVHFDKIIDVAQAHFHWAIHIDYSPKAMHEIWIPEENFLISSSVFDHAIFQAQQKIKELNNPNLKKHYSYFEEKIKESLQTNEKMNIIKVGCDENIGENFL